MYDQTGNTGEGNAAGYGQNPYGNGGFNQEDIFNHFKGFQQQRGGSRGGNFEDIFKDLFGHGRQGHDQRADFEPSVMNISITFEESVKGCTKVIKY